MDIEPIEVGVVSRSFSGKTNKEVAKLLSENDIFQTELCFTATDSSYWNYNGITDIKKLSAKRAEEIVETYRDENIEIVSLGVFSNLLCADDEGFDGDKEWPKVLSFYERHLEIAAENSIPIISTECGFRASARGLFVKSYEADFSRFVDHIGQLCDLALKYNVAVALEPCVLDVVPSAKRMRDLILQVGSPYLHVLLDPANLIANSSEKDMFAYLAPHIAYIHGKDRHVNDTYGRIVGDGDINWPLFFNLYHKTCEDVPFILEYVNEENFSKIRYKALVYDRESWTL